MRMQMNIAGSWDDRHLVRGVVLRVLFSVLGFVIATGCGGGRAGEETVDVDFVSCTEVLMDIGNFARTPTGRMHLISTYDRSGGNTDWAGLTNPGQDGLVEFADLQGPGCVRRIWQTSVSASEWLFFFDGEKVPSLCFAIEGEVKDLFPNAAPLSETLSGASYCYVPIPFRESLRIAVRPRPGKPDERIYYQINYERFPKGVKVRSFDGVMSKRERQAIRNAQRNWISTGAALRRAAEACNVSRELHVPARGSAVWLQHEGAGSLNAFTFRISTAKELSATRKAALLRELTLRIYWDGSERSSVDVPLGAFFCNAFYYREFSSMPLGHVDGRFICRFPMPFRKGVRGVIRNDGNTDVDLIVSSDVDPIQDVDNINYFHASWNQLVSSGLPFRLLFATGKGHYVGCYLTALGMDGSWNILEGDDIVRIDGMDGSLLHGTGLEDYFNGGWYYYGLFERPLHGLLEKAAMQTAQYRFHLTDPIPFSKEIAVSFEFGDANRAAGYMSGVGYWYQSSPSPARTPAVPAERRFPPRNNVEKAAIMAQLFELERIGHYREAIERCLVLGERYSAAGLQDILGLRAAAYRELLGDDKKSNEAYAMYVKSGQEAVARQASDLVWRNEGRNNALLLSHINGAGKVYLDGVLVFKGGHPLQLSSTRIELAPGPHEISVEVMAKWPSPWLRLSLQTGTTNLQTDATWVASKKKPKSWPRIISSDGWTNVKTRALPPWMQYWNFAPNAFVDAQAGRRFLRHQDSWDIGEIVFFSKRFVVPEKGNRAPTYVKESDDTSGLEWEDMRLRSTSGADVK